MTAQKKLPRIISSPIILIGCVLIVTAAAYIRTAGFDFVYDDQLQIVDSEAVHSSKFLPRYFTTHVWQYSQPEVAPTYYRPIFLVWLLLNHTLFGLDSSWWHLSTLAVHLTATLLLYFLAQKLTGDRILALSASLLFGVNPVHIESVAWVSGVTEPLLGVFMVSALLCYANSRQSASAAGRPRWLAGSLVLYGFALLEKESAVVFPVIVFIYESFFGPAQESRPGRLARIRPALTGAVPYVALTAVYLMIRSVVLHGFRISPGSLPFTIAALTEPSVLLFYVRRLIWPAGLSPFYDIAYVTRPVLSLFVLPGLVVIFSGLVLYLWSRRSRVAAFASIWMILTLLPVLNLTVFGPGELVHDRYLYLPSMAFSLLTALVIRRFRVNTASVAWKPDLEKAFVCALAGLLTLGTITQSAYWQSDLTLFRHALIIAPGSGQARHLLATEYGRLGMYKPAIRLLLEELEMTPRSFRATAAVGRYYYNIGAFKEAESYLERAINLRPRGSKIPYAYLGLTRLELGHFDSAESAIREGMGISPLDRSDKVIHGALGTVLERKGDLSGAAAEFRLELTTNPPEPEAVRTEIAQLEARLKVRE